MQYTMVNSYRTDEALDILTWVLVREHLDEPDTWTFAAYPFSAVGDAIAHIEDGVLKDDVECSQVFYFDLRDGNTVFLDDMRESDTYEGPFPLLNWRTA